MATQYDTDFYAWTQNQAAALAAGRFSDLDLVNLAEEVDSLGKYYQNRIKSSMVIVLIHLLEWAHQPDGRYGEDGSGDCIYEHRYRIRHYLSGSPSLRSYLEGQFAYAYAFARMRASSHTGLPLDTFRLDCPWTLDEALDDEFWPADI